MDLNLAAKRSRNVGPAHVTLTRLDMVIDDNSVRVGRKRYEELLIGDRISSTRHPRIQQRDVPFKKNGLLIVELTYLEIYMLEQKLPKITKTLTELVEVYQAKKRSDHIGVQ